MGRLLVIKGNKLSRLIKWEKELLPIGEKHIEKVCRVYVIPLRVETKAKRIFSIASRLILKDIKDVAEACVVLALVDLNEERCLNTYSPHLNHVLCRQLITLVDVTSYFEKPPSALLDGIEALSQRKNKIIITSSRLEVLGVYIRGKSLSIRVPEDVKKDVLQTPLMPLTPSKKIFIDRKVLNLIRFTLSKQRKRDEPKIPEYLERGDLLKIDRMTRAIDANELADLILNVEAREIQGKDSYEYFNNEKRKIIDLYSIIDRYFINPRSKGRKIWSSVFLPQINAFVENGF